MAEADKPEPDKSETTTSGAEESSKSTQAPAKTATSGSKADRRRDTGAKAKAAASTVRSKIASLFWLVAVVCALFLAVGALLVALKANQDNAVVKFVLDGADYLDLDVFSREDGIFSFEKDRDGVKSALVNWGLAAVAYLVVGKIIDRIIRP